MCSIGSFKLVSGIVMFVMLLCVCVCVGWRCGGGEGGGGRSGGGKVSVTVY